MSASGSTDILEEVPPVKKETRVEKLKRGEGARGVYVTQSVLRSKKMNEIFELLKTTEVNAVVIDVKDGDGVYFDDKLKDWIKKLKGENIWLIARVMAFQDNYLAKKSPELALKRSDGSLWRNDRGWYWVDPASKAVWEYNLSIVKKASDYGFDEVNFDYIRFPSDGKLSTIVYPFWDGKTPKNSVMESFFDYLRNSSLKYNENIFLSIDVFGYVFLSGDINIGQNLDIALSYFDFVCPMVYPSHYNPGNFGFKNPAEYPYEVITKTLQRQQKLLDEKHAVLKIRPWLQAFNMGAVYDGRMVGLEKKAAYDFGLKGWLMWNPYNSYPAGHFEKKPAEPVKNGNI
jgi:hypothetical protein